MPIPASSDHRLRSDRLPGRSAPGMLRRLTALGLCALCLAATVSQVAAAEATRVFDLPAGPAERTLKLFSEQAGLGLLISTETARSSRTQTVRGRYAAGEALARMLEQTGLEAVQDSTNGAFVVRRANEAADATSRDLAGRAVPAVGEGRGAVPGLGGSLAGRVRDGRTRALLASAAVSIPSLGRQAVTTGNGEFAFPFVPPGEHLVIVSYLGYADFRRVVVVTDPAETWMAVDLDPQVLKLGEFIVTGQREGQARALQQKRMADGVIDVVSADSAGKLPDGNAAEAVRRLPGVFAEIDQNEGRFLVVRGIDANLNTVTINGLDVGAPGSEGRGTQMDAVPADLISRIEVIKTVTPDMDAQAIGAAINIVMPTAFDRPEPFAQGTLAGGYFSGPGQTMPYSGSAIAGTRFGEGRWGLLVGASYSYRRYVSHRRSGGNEWYPASASGPGTEVYFPAAQSLFRYDVQRWRQGVNASLDYRPDGRHAFFLRLSGNRFKDEEGRDHSNFEFFRTAFPDSFTATSARFVDGRATLEHRHYVQEHRIDQYSVGGSSILGDGSWNLDYTLAFADSGIRVPERIDWEFRTAADLASEIDTRSRYWAVTPDKAFHDPANYAFRRLRIRADDQYEHTRTALLNVKRELARWGHEAFWQTGAKYLARRKGWDRVNRNYYPAPGDTSFNLGSVELAGESREVLDGRFPLLGSIDFEEAQEFFRAHPERFAFNAVDSEDDSLANRFRIGEDLLAGYLMGRIRTGPWSLLGGVRVEDTQVTVESAEFAVMDDGGARARTLRSDHRYTQVLPGAHLRYRAGQDWLLRAAWTNTVGRPAYADLGATRFLSAEQETPGGTVYSGQVTEGNPELKPYESMNVDISSELYLQNTGILSIGLFHKRIRHPIYTHQFTLRDTVYEGRTYSSLDVERPMNGASAEIRGLELNYQQQLTMLPAPLDGFGFAVNYTRTASTATLPTRPGERLPLLKQAGDIGNVALFYEKHSLQARLAYTRTGPYLTNYGATANADTYKAKRQILDARVSYRLSGHFTLFADVINLGEEPLDEYSRSPERNAATERYWWTTHVGVNWRL